MKKQSKEIKYSFIYNRRNKLNKKGLAAVELYLFFDGEKKYITTEIFIKPENWNEKKQRVKACNDVQTHNTKLDEIEKTIIEYKTNIIANGGVYSMADLERQIYRRNSNKFLDFMDREINNRDTKNSTKKTQRVVYNHLLAFKPNVTFGEINYAFVKDFERYLRRQGMQDVSIERCMKALHIYTNEAVKRDLIDIRFDPFRKYSIKVKKKDPVFLTGEELKRIEVLNYSDNNLEYVRNLFLFSCYTGMRISDVQDLRKTDIKKRIIDGVEVKEIVRDTIKHGTPVCIPISEMFDNRIIDILKRHTEPTGEKVFRQLAQPTINRLLKTIASDAGIEKNLHFHTARHTCGTQLTIITKDLGIVQKVLGHKDSRTTQLYSHLTSNDVVNTMRECFKKQ
ncbi:MAG: site-specific integrase [Bacteroidales bacterium]|nr:site-specific integrase [Bacteroidales bacterium]